MKRRLERHYGLGHLHFITCSCYRRKPLLGAERARSLFLKILAEVRERVLAAAVLRLQRVELEEKNEKLNYMHFNPVKRGLARHPKEWLWSSYGFYWRGIANGCLPNPDWKLGAEVAEREKERRTLLRNEGMRHPVSLFEA
jgi:hypothetical protein